LGAGSAPAKINFIKSLFFDILDIELTIRVSPQRARMVLIFCEQAIL
jgi:hypothetical protein